MSIRNLSQQISVLVNNIQDTNRSVQIAVSSLAKSVRTVSDFLEQSVMTDYEQFAQMGNAYSSNMSEMAEMLQAFSHTTDNIHNNIVSIREHVLEIDKMVGDATENTDESKKLTGQVNQYSF